MFLSIFDIFKIGVGPSSSPTMGPMVAAGRFLSDIAAGRNRIPGAGPVARLHCRLHGSLAFTGKGHASDRAVILGLAGCLPDTLDPEKAEEIEARIRADKRLDAPGIGEIGFAPDRDVVFDFGPALELHANALVLSAHDAGGNLHARETYYSVGGGFVKTQAEMTATEGPEAAGPNEGTPFPFSNAADFSGMNGGRDLRISKVIHKAFVAVGEEGTEAAAATAVVVERKSVHRVKEFRADRPFLFLIRDRQTGTILFLGRLADPRG